MQSAAGAGAAATSAGVAGAGAAGAGAVATRFNQQEIKLDLSGRHLPNPKTKMAKTCRRPITLPHHKQAVLKRLRQELTPKAG